MAGQNIAQQYTTMNLLRPLYTQFILQSPKKDMWLKENRWLCAVQMSFKIAYLETKKSFVWQSVNCRGIKFNFEPIYLQALFRDVSEVDILSDLFQLWVGFCCLKVSVWLKWNYPGKRKCLAHMRLVTMKSSQLIFQIRRTKPVWVFVSVIINSNSDIFAKFWLAMHSAGSAFSSVCKCWWIFRSNCKQNMKLFI